MHQGQVQEGNDSDLTFEHTVPSSNRRFLAEADLNYPVQVLKLSKSQAEILASRLKGWNLHQKNELKHFFTQENSLVLVMMLVLLWRPLGTNALLV